MSTGAFRPSQWASPAMVSITVPAQQGSTVDAQGNITVTQVGQTTYVFDAVIDLDHIQRLTQTSHPVQTGADISSHAYLQPAELAMYVGMSDAMDAYSTGSDPAKAPYITPFTGNTSKSVSAYQEMLTLQASRIPLIVTTRLRTYKNMLVSVVAPREDYRTIAGLKMRLVFTQIYTAAISSSPISSRDQDTGSTGLGQVNPQTPSNSVTKQFNAADSLNATTSSGRDNLVQYLRTVPGSGDWSSTNVDNLQQLPPPSTP